jgi:hypothetical protein
MQGKPQVIPVMNCHLVSLFCLNSPLNYCALTDITETYTCIANKKIPNFLWNVKVQYCIDSLAVEPYPDLSESIQTLVYYLFKIYLNTVFLFLPRSCTGYMPFLTSYSCALALLSPHPVILPPPLLCCFRCTITLRTKWQTVHCFLIVLQLQLLNCVVYECIKCVYWEFKLFYSSVQSLPILT